MKFLGLHKNCWRCVLGAILGIICTLGISIQFYRQHVLRYQTVPYLLILLCFPTWLLHRDLRVIGHDTKKR